MAIIFAELAFSAAITIPIINIEANKVIKDPEYSLKIAPITEIIPVMAITFLIPYRSPKVPQINPQMAPPRKEHELTAPNWAVVRFNASITFPARAEIWILQKFVEIWISAIRISMTQRYGLK